MDNSKIFDEDILPDKSKFFSSLLIKKNMTEQLKFGILLK